MRRRADPTGGQNAPDLIGLVLPQSCLPIETTLHVVLIEQGLLHHRGFLSSIYTGMVVKIKIMKNRLDGKTATPPTYTHRPPSPPMSYILRPLLSQEHLASLSLTRRFGPPTIPGLDGPQRKRCFQLPANGRRGGLSLKQGG